MYTTHICYKTFCDAGLSGKTIFDSKFLLVHFNNAATKFEGFI